MHAGWGAGRLAIPPPTPPPPRVLPEELGMVGGRREQERMRREEDGWRRNGTRIYNKDEIRREIRDVTSWEYGLRRGLDELEEETSLP